MNNNYFNEKCPSLMNNNRILTSYVLSSELNQKVCKELNCTDEHSYRKLLQENAVKIIEDSKKNYENVYPCSL